MDQAQQHELDMISDLRSRSFRWKIGALGGLAITFLLAAFPFFMMVHNGGHCIKVTLLSGSRERTKNLCGIAKIIFPKWPEAIWAEWRFHVPQVVAGQSDMGPAKRRDVFDDVIWDGDAVFPQIND